MQIPSHKLGEKSFDSVFSNAALHWCKRSPSGVIEGVTRMLKDGGRFVGEMGGYLNVIGTGFTRVSMPLRKPRNFQGYALAYIGSPGIAVWIQKVWTLGIFQPSRDIRRWVRNMLPSSNPQSFPPLASRKCLLSGRCDLPGSSYNTT